jgi:hypothetical protein
VRHDADLTLRRARTEDAAALRRVAERDSTIPPRGESLVAEVDRTIVAWLELESRRVAADPFQPTAAVVRLLRERAGQLHMPGRTGAWAPPKVAFRRRRRRAAASTAA